MRGGISQIIQIFDLTVYYYLPLKGIIFLQYINCSVFHLPNMMELASKLTI